MLFFTDLKNLKFSFSVSFLLNFLWAFWVVFPRLKRSAQSLFHDIAHHARARSQKSRSVAFTELKRLPLCLYSLESAERAFHKIFMRLGEVYRIGVLDLGSSLSLWLYVLLADAGFFWHGSTSKGVGRVEELGESKQQLLKECWNHSSFIKLELVLQEEEVVGCRDGDDVFMRVPGRVEDLLVKV